MKSRTFKLLSIAAFIGILAACQPEEPEVVFEFDVKAPQGVDINATQQFTYSQKVEYTFTAKGAKNVTATAPQGWTATASLGSKNVVIEAPAAKDMSAAASGTVTIVATSTKDETKEVKLQVAVSDAAITYSVANLPSKISLYFGGSTEFTATASNVETVEATAPKGWTVTADASKVKVQAPARSDTAAEQTGTITLTPKSARGNAGTAISVPVEIVISAPSLAFNETEAKRVAFGSTTTLTAKEADNIETAKATVPQGWNANYSISDKKLTITAPSMDVACEGEGNVIISVVSKSGDALDVTIPVSLVGINSANDFMDFAAAAIADGGDLTPFKYNDEVILNNDIDLSEVSNNVMVNGTFSGVFNGRGNAITLAINTAEAHAGLFGTVENATIKNLKTKGSLNHSGQDVKVTMSAIALFAKGECKFENVSNYATITQTGTNKDSWGYVAGLFCDIQGNATLNDCHNYGAITCVSPKYFGGIVASIWDKTVGEMRNCSNEGQIKFNFNGLKTDGMHAGGVYGTNCGADWKFYNCYNSGDISYNLGTQGIRVLGGFAGMAQGYFENCYNTGNVTNLGYLETAPSEIRRVGGFAGGTWEDSGLYHYSKNCYNTGNVTEVGDYIGGYIGMSEYSAKYENCYNSGNVVSISKNFISLRVGGFAGGMWNDGIMINCTNKGKVICTTRRVAAGLAVVGDDVQLIGCSNEGEVKVGTVEGYTAKAWSPIIAGLCVMSGTGAAVKIENCKNTGEVTGMAQFEVCVQSLYTSEALADKANDPTSTSVDKTICDEASKTASAGAKVTFIPKAQWSLNTIFGWLQ